MNEPTTEPEPTCDFGWSLGLIAKGYNAIVAAEAVDLPRGIRGYQVLYAVVNYDLPSQFALSDYLCIDRTVMPYVIDDLVDAELVQRQASPDDRRRKKVVITDRGASELRRIETRVHEAETRLLAALSKTEQATFIELASTIARALRDDTGSHDRSIPAAGMESSALGER